MESTPLVSVIIPTYNRADKLLEAVYSVMNQSYGNWELIVVDDKSTDNTKQVVSELSMKEKRIRYIVNQRTKGPAGARNQGMMNAAGKYIAFLDSDDQWTEYHLSESMEALEKNGAQVCFGLWMQNHCGRIVKMGETPDWGNDLKKAISILQPGRIDKMCFFKDNFFEYAVKENFYCYQINTMVFNKEVLAVTGMFNEKLHASEDAEFAMRVLSKFNLCFICDYHFVYNQGIDNLYLFIDRMNMDLNKIIYNADIVDRLTFNGIYKNKSRKMLKSVISSTPHVMEKKKCFETINKMISLKYFTLAYINIKLHKGKALEFILKSLLYDFDGKKLLLALNTLFSRKNDMQNFANQPMDFW